MKEGKLEKQNGTGPADHQHLLVTATTPKRIIQKLNEESLCRFLLRVVDRIGMTMLIPPQVGYSNRDANTGYTGFLGITTSHIAFHHYAMPNPGILHFEVFSCRTFDTDHAVKLFRDRLGLTEIRVTKIARDIPQ